MFRILFLIIFLLNLFSQNAVCDNWGKRIKKKPLIVAASDVPQPTVDIVYEWYKVGAEAWGNFGPLEIYVVGKSVEAAVDLENFFCERRMNLDQNWDKKYDCANERHKVFRHIPEEGGAFVSTYRRPNLDYDFFTLTMGTERPYPNEEDYKQTILHEYWHIYQHSRITDECTTDRRDKCERDKKLTGDYEKRPWMHEGGATYMGLLVYSREIANLKDLKRQMFRYRKRSFRNYFKSSMNLSQFKYKGEEKRLAYDIGAWFVAYLIHQEGEQAFKTGFYGDLDKFGFEQAFARNFGQSTADYISEFNDFIIKHKSDKTKLAELFPDTLLSEKPEFELNSKDFYSTLSMCKRKLLQIKLKEEGFYKGKIDGFWGAKTSSAIDSALSKYNLGMHLNEGFVKKFKLHTACEN